MKRIVSILLVIVPLFVVAQIQQPVKWSGEEIGDSVRCTAMIEPGWHMTLISVGEQGIGEDIYETPYHMMIGKTEKIRFTACNDVNCLSPEVWGWDGLADQNSTVHNQPSAVSSPLSSVSSQLSEHNVHKWEFTNERSIWWIFVLGLLGGLIAIFTPCVWPIIPMTVSFFLKRTDNGLRNAALYGLSIIILYVGLGLLVTILFGASALNDLSTNAVVNIIFFVILVLFALSFFGLFEITLPDSWSTKLDSKARSTGGFLSILFMAFTLVIVSFSCTGPIIGTLLVEAAGKSLLAPAIGMLGFAVALALPFSLFALFPQWLKRAPKSGDWMTSFKVVLAFLELALSLKFLSVADMAYGWGILPRWLFIAIWIGCFAGIGIYLLWRIHKVNWLRRAIRSLIIIPSFAFAGYLVPGLWGAPVKVISAFAPPMKIEGLDVFHDFEQGLAYAKQEHKPVIVDFTGYGCVNCRKMEAYVLDDARVKARLQRYVFIELFVDAKQDGIGDKNSRLQRELFGSNAQPYYVQLDADGRQIAEPMAFTTDPNEFMNWLLY
ncbi:MAG: thioredoxin family protein [Paludibacteraceae bacterium]|nr:thioredoxin family protein [Paludibacteraceae bacterium]